MVLFARLRVEKAALYSLLGAYFLLPSNLEFEIPSLPPLDKTSVAAITTFILCLFKPITGPSRRVPIVIYLLCAVFVLSPLLTSFSNSYELQSAAGSIPGFYPLDGVKYIGRQLIVLLPLFIGARVFSSDYGRRLLLLSLPWAILFYSPLMLFEVRISPQLHRWAYGYIPSAFAQQIRDGGFRPVVFLSHGLELALITSLALISIIILSKNRARIARIPARVLAAYFSGLLFLCKSLGPTIFALGLAPVIWFTRPRTWVKISCAILVFVAIYPGIRTAHVIPLEEIDRISHFANQERSDSFKVRITNEEQLLARANEKPLTGWGGWGRNRLRDQWTGQDISVTDGGWIVVFGTWGWIGYASTFLLFAVSAFRANRETGGEVTDASITLGGLVLLLAVYVLNMLPNSTNIMLPLLIAGSMGAAASKVGARRPSISPRGVFPRFSRVHATGARRDVSQSTS